MASIQQDQSMEDILASIKRIIADEGDHFPPVSPSLSARHPAPHPAHHQDVLELTDVVSSPSLISADAAHVSRSALNSLGAVARDAGQRDYGQADDTLNRVVTELLRPLLKQWLDQHLPHIVETMVQQEIARITGKK